MQHQRPLILSSAAAVAAFALLAAGCGGNGSPGVANGTSATTAAKTTTTQNGLVAFSQCMRANGVSSFPDPKQYVGGNVKLTLHSLQTSNPHFQAATEACNNLLPPNRGAGSQQTAAQKRTQLVDELSFATCMRSHGVSRFPDPTAQGELPVANVQAQGIDVHAPQFLRIVTTCLPASHGALTPAKVREALNNAGG